PMWNAARDSKMMTWPYQSPRRGASTAERPFGEFDGCIGGWEIEGEPFTTAPGTTFDWWRARMLGGRTNHWGRISLRFGPYDFRRRSMDGLGDDWPISYDDLKPYYDKVDTLVGLFGTKENLPNEPDGIFQPPPKPRCYELLVKQACDRLHVTCIPSRLSILTRLLLNSKSTRFPNGLANSSGVVGRYLTDTTGLYVGGVIPKLADSVPHNEDGVGGMHLYMPWWLDNSKLDFPRGYHIEFGGGRH